MFSTALKRDLFRRVPTSESGLALGLGMVLGLAFVLVSCYGQIKLWLSLALQFEPITLHVYNHKA